ncbi:MAG: mechanosensitive ion channel family protein, partial [Spirochaetaceae bacterium]|nr:mechanosensitive ion channel family protein [Spirochaetaceae bacterium]
PASKGDWGLRLIKNFAFPILIIAGFYIATTFLELDGSIERIVSGFFMVLFSLVTIKFFVIGINTFFKKATEGEQHANLSRYRPLRSIIVIAIWVVGMLFLLANLGFDITTIVAGLGIGGIAVALAAQALLGDLFSYFVIVFDKPFELGDFLIIGDILGSVEKIGIKTTRIRSISGEQIILSNSDLTDSRVRNYKRMEKRRVVFKIGVVYGTPAEAVREIPAIIRAVVEAEDSTTFDRAHFAGYGDWSLIYEVVYYVASADYALYMDIQQSINLAIYDEFSKRGIQFAYPTQTILLGKPQESDKT